MLFGSGQSEQCVARLSLYHVLDTERHHRDERVSVGVEDTGEISCISQIIQNRDKGYEPHSSNYA